MDLAVLPNMNRAPGSARERAAFDQCALEGTVSEYLKGGGANVLDRLSPLTQWLDHRYENGVDPYSKYTDGEIRPVLAAHGRKGARFEGINFASQDYLNLASHASVKQAAIDAIAEYGVHSAGSAALMGNSAAAIELEEALSAFVGLGDSTLFSTGWGAGYGIIKLLVRDDDHVVIDVLAHACLMEGARNATSNVHVHPHVSAESVERRLKKIRQSDARAGIVVVTESTFSMDSDVPDLLALQSLCREYDATLVVDCAHDLGAIGNSGRGYIEIQGMVGKIDVLMGSFSKTFASNGGFVATNHRALKLALRYNCGPQTFTNAMSPVAARIVRTCLRIVSSQEGAERRAALLANALFLRRRLTQEGFTVLGQPSAIVPVILGDSGQSRLMTKFTLENGGIVNLVEFPAVSKNTCRWRLQVMAEHTPDHIEAFVGIAVQARRWAQTTLRP